jgi:hypothetical protein
VHRDHALTALAALATALLVAASCGRAPEPDAKPAAPNERPAPAAEPARDLVDEARERGIDYVNKSGEPEKRTVLEANGAGVAALDLESDGDLDLVFAQGCASLRQLLDGPGADLEVFVNQGDGRFARRAGPGLNGWWNGLAAGDVDNDGDADLVAGGFGSLRVLLQTDRGELVPGAELVPEGSARLVPGEKREAGHPPAWISSLALFDSDRDGLLDLYVGQYLDLDPVAPPLHELGTGVLAIPCEWKGHEVFCGPRGMVPQADRLLRGNGDGTFRDESERLREQVASYALAVCPFDFDGDGDDDVYVANDSMANLLWLNDGKGTFVDVAYSAGVALSNEGAPEAGMGIAFGDVNRDGRFDFALTNFSGEPTAMYFGRKFGFANETFRFGLQRETRALLKWSVHLVDFDADGWLELFTANGHVYPQADLKGTGTSYGQRCTLWKLRARGDERVLESVESSDERSVLFPAVGTRGTALGDFDGDGAPDLALARIDGPAALGMNRFASKGHRLAVRCLGPLRAEPNPGGKAGRTPADGMGTRVIVVPRVASAADEFALLGEVQTACGYQSSSTPWLSFGLGESDEYAQIRVLWPSGRVDELPAGKADRRITIKEGVGLVSEEALP